MERSHILSVASVMVTLAFLLPSMGALLPTASGEDGDEATAPPGLPRQDVAEWTFMVYLDADNNLEGAGIEDMNEMETVGSTDEINVVVEMDRIAGEDTSNGDWEGAKRFLMQADDDTSVINSPELEDMGEINMGDPQTLVDFVLWSMENFPAKRYMLDLWDHGGAFRGVCWDDTVDLEDADYDMLTMDDLTWALDTIRAVTGEPLDLMGFDACLMGDIAVQYQVRYGTRFCLGSGYNEPGEGWPYEKILPPLADKPTMGPEELGRIIVQEYVDSYTDREEDPQDTLAITQALFDMSKMDRLASTLDRMSLLLATRAGSKYDSSGGVLLGKNEQIRQARRVTNSYDMFSAALPANVIQTDFSGYALYDVIDLMENLKDFIPADMELHTLADEVIEATNDALAFFMANKYHGDFKGAHGATVYFPSGIETEYSTEFDDTDFARDLHWDEFLGYYYTREGAGDTPPAISVSEPVPGQVVEGKEFTVRGTAFDLQSTPVVEIRIDDGEWTEVAVSDVGEGDSSWSYTWDLEELERGNHTVSVRAVDSGGAMSPVLVRQVFVEPDLAGEDRSVVFLAIVGGVTLGFLGFYAWVGYTRRQEELRRGRAHTRGK